MAPSEIPPSDLDDDEESLVRKIGDAVDGKWLKFVGKVVACEGEPLVAPLSGRTCACFDAAHWSSSGELLTRTLRGTPFVIEDGTGRALVDPRGAFVRLTHDFKQRGYEEASEGVLEIGESVLVSGFVQVTASGDAGIYRVSADTRVRVVGSREFPADVTDLRAEIRAAGGVVPRDPPPPIIRKMPPPPLRTPQRTRQHVSGRRIPRDD